MVQSDESGPKNEKRTEMERKSTHADPFLSYLMEVLERFLASFAFDNRVFGF